jgi:hypothetical protein
VRARSRSVLGVGLCFVVVLALGACLYPQWWTDHYTPGRARIEAYAFTERPTELEIFFTSGWQDIVEEPIVSEDPRAVTITIPTRVFVPGRDGFKQLSATLGQTTVRLREPLAQRALIDGTTRRGIARRGT